MRILTKCLGSETLNSVKPVIFHHGAREVLREFPEAIRRAIGQALYDLQKGERLGMPLSKPMPSVAMGVEELRVKDSSGAYRTFYYLKSARGILVFHAFMKKTQATPRREIEVGRRRLKELLNEEE